jgi:DNA-binding beta-propeller fold protein YncE
MSPINNRTMNTVTPEVGMGVTYRIGSDCYPYSIIAVSASKKTIFVTRDDFRLVSGSEETGNAVYKYTTRTDLGPDVVTLRKDGRWRLQGEKKGSGIYVIGERRAYNDPSF